MTVIFQKVMGKTLLGGDGIHDILGGPGNTAIGDDYLNGGDDDR